MIKFIVQLAVACILVVAYGSPSEAAWESSADRGVQTVETVV